MPEAYIQGQLIRAFLSFHLLGMKMDQENVIGLCRRRNSSLLSCIDWTVKPGFVWSEKKKVIYNKSECEVGGLYLYIIRPR